MNTKNLPQSHTTCQNTTKPKKPNLPDAPKLSTTTPPLVTTQSPSIKPQNQPKTAACPTQKHPKPPLGHKKSTDQNWTDRIRVSSATLCHLLDDIDHDVRDDRTEFEVPLDCMGDIERWKRCLVGVFSGSKMPFHAVKSIATRIWSSYGLEEVIASENFFLFRFCTIEDMLRVEEDGPWLFGTKFLFLEPWHIDIDLQKTGLETVPVWIRLYGLPLPLWTQKGLSFAANCVGDPIFCDRKTFDCSRFTYARVCVNLHADKPPIHEFFLKTTLSSSPIRVRVKYEWKPSRCPSCRVFGHVCKKGVDSEPSGFDSDDDSSILASTPARQSSDRGIAPMVQQRMLPLCSPPDRLQGTSGTSLVLDRQPSDRGKTPIVQSGPTLRASSSEHEASPPLTPVPQRVSSSDAIQGRPFGRDGIGVSSRFSPLDPDLRECTLNTEAVLTPETGQPTTSLRYVSLTPTPTLQVGSTSHPDAHQLKKKKKKKKKK